MMLSFRKVASRLAAVVFVGAMLAGCRMPWQPKTVVIDVPKANLARISQDAVIALRQAAEDDVPSTRFIALEAIPGALGRRGGAICKQALDDPSPEVRAAAAMGIGDLRYAPAKEKLRRMVLFDVQGAERDVRTYCAAIYALHQLGDTTHTTHLGGLLFDREKEVRAIAAAVMGKMRLKAAISPLKSALTDEIDHDLRFELTRALARCGDKSSLRKIEAHTRERFVDEQIIAVRAMIELKSSTCRALFSSLAANDESPRVKVAAAGGLAELGYETPALFRYCVQAARRPREVMQAALGDRRKASVRQTQFLQGLAATALGEFKHAQAIDVVAELLKSPIPMVRVAAAASILKTVPQLSEPEPPKVKKKIQAPPPVQTKPAPKRVKLHTAGGKD